MSSIRDFKILKNYGKKLGREKLALRVIEVCKSVALEENYKDAIRALGKFRALATSCNFDSYWSEKRDGGYHEELHVATKILAEFDASLDINKLTHRYLVLPYPDQIRIAEELELLQKGDTALEKTELFRRVISRAKGRNLLQCFLQKMENLDQKMSNQE